jgi:BASS family bile acid:Na+ symporter
MFILPVVSIVTTPVTLNMVLRVDEAIKVPVGHVMATLVVLQLLPLVLGMLVKHRAERLSNALKKPVTVLSTLGLLGTVVLFVVPRFDVLGQVAGGGALAIMVFLVVVAWPIGWGLGGRDASIRKVLALGTSLRNIGLCLLLATENFPGTGVAAAVTAYLLIQAIANFVFAKRLARTPTPGGAGASARPSSH